MKSITGMKSITDTKSMYEKYFLIHLDYWKERRKYESGKLEEWTERVKLDICFVVEEKIAVSITHSIVAIN